MDFHFNEFYVPRFYFQGNLVISKTVPFTHTVNVFSGATAKPLVSPTARTNKLYINQVSKY